MKTELKLGAFYTIYSLKGVPMMVRPIEENDKNVFFYSPDSDSVFSTPKPIKNKLEFHKDAVKEELKHFRKNLNKLYRDRFHVGFSGKFYLDTAATEPIKLPSHYLDLSSNPKKLKKKIREDIGLAIESKNMLTTRYKEIVKQIKQSNIKSEKSNLYQMLKTVREDRVTARNKVKQLRQQFQEI